MHRSFVFWPTAVVLMLGRSTPARAATLFAQGDGPTPSLEYLVALASAAVVLCVVCWPAKRQQ